MEPVNEQRVYSNRYQVTHLIARGGMALVYRAQDQLLNRPVALKILYPELSANPSFVERFRREAQAAANLSHPNIVPVFDWGEDAGTYFIVMELVDGQSLAEVLRGGRTLTASRTAQLGAQVASALGYAHRQGMVHRDVKPGNILITPEAQVKVTDFGIAQAVASEDHLAEEGSVMGTATYFSPEQAGGAPVDGRSDLYSLGIVLYEMLAGRPPFTGDTPLAVSSQHVHDTVTPLGQANPSVPRDLEAIVMKALAKSPAARYNTGDEMRSDLLRFVDGQPVLAANKTGAFAGADATQAVGVVTAGERTQAVPVFSGPRTDVKAKNKRSRGGPWAIAAVVVALVAAGLGYYLVAGKGTVTLTNVVNQQVAAADATLRSEGVTPIEQLVSSNEKTGTVIKMTPAAGTTVAANSSVTLEVAIGSTAVPVTVPNEIGLSIVTAEANLQSIGLGYVITPISTTSTTTSTTTATGSTSSTSSTSTSTSTTTTYPGGKTPQPNVVLNQSPVGGTSVRKGTTVTLYYLPPTSNFPVPNVAGSTPTQAAATLGQEGLTVAASTSSACSNKVATGNVVGTSPSVGSPVSSGASITLVLSSGVCQVVVPNVVGQTEANAAATLVHVGLTPQPTPATPALCTSSTLGDIVSQSISGGSFASYNSDVVIDVCDTASGSTTTTSTTNAG
jgi:serine/threonine-protein kinase